MKQCTRRILVATIALNSAVFAYASSLQFGSRASMLSGQHPGHDITFQSYTARGESKNGLGIDFAGVRKSEKLAGVIFSDSIRGQSDSRPLSVFGWYRQHPDRDYHHRGHDNDDDYVSGLYHHKHHDRHDPATVVSEPPALTLLGIGLLGMAGLLRLKARIVPPVQTAP